MRLKSFNLQKSVEAKAFHETLEKLSTFQGYKKQLKRTLKTLKSGWVDFYFFHKFHFGSRRLPCFLFGALDEEPWKTLIEGGEIDYMVNDEAFAREGKGWENDYKSAKGKAKRIFKGDDEGWVVYLKIRGGKTVMKTYEADLEEMFMEVFDTKVGDKRFVDFQILGEDDEEDKLVTDAANKATNSEQGLIALLKQEIKEFNAVDKDEFGDRLEEIEDMRLLIEEAEADWRDKAIKDDMVPKVMAAMKANIKKYDNLKLQFDQIEEDERTLDEMLKKINQPDYDTSNYEEDLDFIEALETKIKEFSKVYYKTEDNT